MFMHATVRYCTVHVQAISFTCTLHLGEGGEENGRGGRVFADMNEPSKRAIAQDMNKSTKRRAQQEEGRVVQDMKDSPNRRAHRGEVHGFDRLGQVRAMKVPIEP